MLVLHPGFEKTGTKTLQESVFGCHSGILNLGRPFDPFGKQFGELLRAPEGEYDDLVFGEMVDRVKMSGKTAVLSDEHLPKNPYMRGTIAARLARYFPEARVIFTIRNQLDAIESYYGNHGRILKDVPAPFNSKFVTLENWLQYSWNTWATSFLGLCDYNRTITLYRDLFGNDRMNILLFEELRDDVDTFAETLGKILQFDTPSISRMLNGKIANPRDPARLVVYSRWREKFFPRVNLAKTIPFGPSLQSLFHRNLKRGRPFQRPIPDTWNRRLSIAYAQGNKEITSVFGLPLAKHGYPLNTDISKGM